MPTYLFNQSGQSKYCRMVNTKRSTPACWRLLWYHSIMGTWPLLDTNTLPCVLHNLVPCTFFLVILLLFWGSQLFCQSLYPYLKVPWSLPNSGETKPGLCKPDTWGTTPHRQICQSCRCFFNIMSSSSAPSLIGSWYNTSATILLSPFTYFKVALYSSMTRHWHKTRLLA